MYLFEHFIEYDREYDEGVIPSAATWVRFDAIHQITFKVGEKTYTAMCHPGSKGYAEGLIELVTEDESIGNLTCSDVIEKLSL